MKNPHEVVIRALITEKGTQLRERGNTYLFQVHTEANKIEIKSAVEKVRTHNVLGKLKRMGRFMGRRPSWKKAVVTLKQGDSIELFEEV